MKGLIDMTRDAIGTDKQFVAPVGPFSLGVRGAGLLFLSGHVAQDPASGRLIDGDVARQTHQILRNIATALDTVGKSLEDVVRVGVYLTDISDFAVMSQAYSEHFNEPYPARTAIAVAALPLGAEVEMDVVVG
jgi:2-iminobutanoate/2-iminopropanoate deaminase